MTTKELQEANEEISRHFTELRACANFNAADTQSVIGVISLPELPHFCR